MNPIIAAAQMYQAFRKIEREERMNFTDFGEAQTYHFNLNTEGIIYDY